MVDGKMCREYSYALRPGQRVEVLMHTSHSHHKISLPVIHEDNYIIVIDKPYGMLSISTDKEREKTAYHIVNEYIKSCNKSGRIFIVHRLDRETSGVMLFAKSEQIKRVLQENWNDNVIRRGYTAVVEGKVQAHQRKIVSWLKQTKTFLVYSSNKKDDGKLAITNYQVLKTTNKYSLLDISLDTGRKNQIRVHMKDIGHPVTGDKKYGALTNPFGRVGLHASVLIVKHPSSGEEMRFEADMPGVFTTIF